MCKGKRVGKYPIIGYITTVYKIGTHHPPACILFDCNGSCSVLETRQTNKRLQNLNVIYDDLFYSVMNATELQKFVSDFLGST